MKVLQITPSFYPSMGGVERVVAELSKALSLRGHYIKVVSASASGCRPESDKLEGIEILRLPSFRPHGAYYYSKAVAKYVSRAGSSYDIVHIHSIHAVSSIQALRASRAFRTVVNPHYHGGGHSNFRKLMWLAFRPVCARAMGKTRAVVCVSPAEAQLVGNHFPEVARNIRIIPNGCAFPTFEQINAEAKNPYGILYVGRLEKYKGVDLLLRAMEYLDERFSLTIVGSGSMLRRLTRTAMSSSYRDRVKVIARAADAELVRLYAKAGILVNLSRREAFGLASLEALQHGCRLLLAGHSPLRGVIPELDKWSKHLDEDAVTPESIASAIVSLSENPPPTSVPRLPAWDDVAEHYEQVYEEVVGD